VDVTPQPTAPSCPTRTRLYLDGKVIAEEFGSDEVAARMQEHPDAVLWLDLLDPGMEDLRTIQHEFHLHPLAVEDAVHDHQRPKLDRYLGHMFMNVYSVAVDLEGERPSLTKHEISAFITERALITVRKSDADVDSLLERWDADPGLGAKGGISFLVYGLLDLIVDGQHAAARALDEAMDKTEDSILDEGSAPRPVRMYAFALRKVLAELRRPVAPMPGLIGQVLRADSQLLNDHLAPYYRDVDDHAQQATDTIDHARERINSLIEADLTEQSNSLNDITRKLAAWAAIIAVPTALTGYFGQNLPYPGYQTFWGFLLSLGLIVVIAGALYYYLKRRGWL
jgi:magnesium transporter